MKKTDFLITFMRMYYPDSNIPVYLFSDETCIFCLPEQSPLTHPPVQYLHKLFSSRERISYHSTEYGIIFCSLKLNSSNNEHLIFGPVTEIPYTNSDLQHLYKDYTIPNEYHSEFQLFLQRIPCFSLTSLLRKCIFLNYCLHKEVISIDRLTASSQTKSDSTLETDTSLFTEENYHKKENEEYNQTYAIEEQLLKLVRTGNCNGLMNLEFNDSNFHTGVTGSTALRQLKNNCIITTTICTRAAIDGGLDYATAYHLSDYFIQTAERLNTAEQLYNLLGKISYIFTEKVAQTKIPVSSDERLQKAIQYIQQNTNQHLTVGDVADYVGFSKSYFSTYFKSTLGFSVSAFILRCKLEEGRELLQYTNKSISTISTFLCFSSQSHFHTAFKKQFGITPSEYRNNTQHKTQ